MKPLAHDFSMTRLIGLGGGLLVLAVQPAGVAARPCGAVPPPSLPPDLMAAAAEARAYPTFCSIPPPLVGVRNAGAFKGAVMDTRIAGARLVSQTAPSTFSLGDTDDYAAAGRAEAAPPPPMTAPIETTAEDFAKAARDRARPPKRPR